LQKGQDIVAKHAVVGLIGRSAQDIEAATPQITDRMSYTICQNGLMLDELE